MMEEQQSHMTERILNLTLEIIYLLTGESFPPVKSGDHVTITVPPCDSLKPETPNMEKIVEATRKMMELLTGETEIMNNSKINVKEEDDEHSMMEEASYPCPLDSQDHNDQSKNLESGHLVVKEENIEEDEAYGGAKERSEGHKKDLTTPHHDQGEDLIDIKVEVKSEEMYVREDQRSMEEAGRMRNSIEEAGMMRTFKEEDTPPHIINEENIEEDEAYGGAKERSEGHKEELATPHHDQGEDLTDIKVEVKSEETYVREDQRSMEEAGMMRTSKEEDKPPHIINVRGRHVEKISEDPEDEDVTDYIPGEDHDVPQEPHSAEGPSSSSEDPQLGRSSTTVPTKAAHHHSHKCQDSFTCPDCGECFVKRSDLPRYQNSDTAAKPYSCSECGNCFSSKGTLTIHQRSHTGERRHPCPECGESFFRKYHLTTHQRTHTGEKPYPCSECGKRFASKSSLYVHQRNHTGDKPYCCTECEKCFAHKSQLVIHLRSHTGERPYTCEECGKSFARRSNFHTHQRTHRRWEKIPAEERERFLKEVLSYQPSEVPHST